MNIYLISEMNKEKYPIFAEKLQNTEDKYSNKW